MDNTFLLNVKQMSSKTFPKKMAHFYSSPNTLLAKLSIKGNITFYLFTPVFIFLIFFLTYIKKNKGKLQWAVDSVNQILKDVGDFSRF